MYLWLHNFRLISNFITLYSREKSKVNNIFRDTFAGKVVSFVFQFDSSDLIKLEV